ncbi:MAG: hypothetical protein XE11_1214 [Methanomicrobiales archaeon 53_19]|nr:MAG: hypothetical protein XD88_0553 [Methanocalculus sp. 52_23]KUL03499.1 MAG: hypothetical protein XE11_1214 [Methanomicrobiales archaeon 53_19]
MPVRGAWRPPGGAIRPAHEDIWRFAPTACYWSLSFEPVVFTYCRLCGWGLKHMRCGYRGAGWPRIRMTEVIYPCSSEQPERRFERIGVYLLWQPLDNFPPSPHCICGCPAYIPCEAYADGVRGGGGFGLVWVDLSPKHPPGGHRHPPPDAGEGGLAATRRGRITLALRAHCLLLVFLPFHPLGVHEFGDWREGYWFSNYCILIASTIKSINRNQNHR